MKYSILTSNLKSQTDNLGHESENGSVWLKRRSFRIALLGIFTALAVVFGYMLVNLPNIELFTLMIFLSGFIMGKKDGMLVGLLSAIIFCLFNLYGASPLPLLAYQLTHYSLTGLAGALTRNYLNKKSYFKPKTDLYVPRILILFGLIGAIITFVYDILSTFFGGLIVSFAFEYFVAQYLIGLVYSVIHLIGNALGFIFILPGLIQLILKQID